MYRIAIFEVHNFRRSCNLKSFADEGNPVSHACHLRLFAVPDQSVKNAKMMRLEIVALYGIILCSRPMHIKVHSIMIIIIVLPTTSFM